MCISATRCELNPPLVPRVKFEPVGLRRLAKTKKKVAEAMSCVDKLEREMGKMKNWFLPRLSKTSNIP